MTPFTLVAGDFVLTGGMDKMNYALADYLARSGHPLRLVAHRVAPELAARPGVTVRRVFKPFGSYSVGQFVLDRAGREVARRSAGRVVVNGGNCAVGDVNWVHYVHAAYSPPPPSGGLRRLRAGIERPLSVRIERRAVRAARLVVCNSDRTRRDVIDRLGVSPAAAVTIYYGVDPDEFQPAGPAERAALRRRLGWPADRPVVLFIGGLGDRRKGFDTLFAAWQRLVAGGWDGKLAVVGRGRDLPDWVRRSEAAGTAAHIEFLGLRSDVPALLRAADALVAPTRYEAYGLGVHEAVCCGLPAFVSAAAGVAERYPPELADLLLPDPDDAEDLAARLVRWRDDRPGYAARVAPFAAGMRAHTADHMSRDILRAVEHSG